MGEFAIEIEGLSYKRQNFKLDHINMTVPKGYVTGFIGVNGAGKTTLIRLIMDLISPTQGNIYILNQTMKEAPVAIKDRIGFVYSELYLNERWSIQKVEKLIAPFYSRWDHDIFLNFLERFGLNYKQKIQHLSTGMKMKLSLAIAFSHHAELFIFDEPTAGLDPVVRHEVLEMIQDLLLDANKTVLFSTHITSDLERIADYIVHLKDGKIVFQDSKEHLLETHRIVRGDVQDLDAELASLMIHYQTTDVGFTGMTKHADVFKELFGNRVTISNASIEDVMIAYEKGTSEIQE
ncbi:phenol-soluble modulin export ABC transporter ATP-binding protein PmtA [Staphylococcus canis]|uniref:ABC transporter ATP-binding protein n=1 Tax=Staphylococcus canis TaxID=2724942 RepID=A0ABS0T896_9STAP|nr:ABC transporter ATP-binding protein [Staphylococcus canis]MBI5974780.1 ABC transporter ATP-binding protein [Staphylococcus canis]